MSDLDLNENKANSIDLSDREADAKWYVIHTYSGYENKVKATIEKMIVNRGTADGIFKVEVPTEEYVEKKDGVKKIKSRKIFPSYVLVKMIINDKSWYLVRNTRGVTGFVGPQSKPIPLTEKELYNLGVHTKSIIDDTKKHVNYKHGDHLAVTDGPFKGFEAIVDTVNEDAGTIKCSVNMFGRDTLVEFEYYQVSPITK